MSDLRDRADDPRPDVLDRLLNDLDIYGELYVVSEDLEADGELVEKLMERAAAHLDKWGFCRLDFRPVHPVRPGRLNGIREVYSALLERMKPFHKEALVHQMASRIMTIPVLRIDNTSDPSEVKKLLDYMREWMMVPSLSIRPSPRLEQWASLLDTERERVLLEEQDGPLETVVLNNLFERSAPMGPIFGRRVFPGALYVRGGGYSRRDGVSMSAKEGGSLGSPGGMAPNGGFERMSFPAGRICPNAWSPH